MGQEILPEGKPPISPLTLNWLKYFKYFSYTYKQLFTLPSHVLYRSFQCLDLKSLMVLIWSICCQVETIPTFKVWNDDFSITMITEGDQETIMIRPWFLCRECTCSSRRILKKSLIWSPVPARDMCFQFTAWWLVHQLPLELVDNLQILAVQVNRHLKGVLLGNFNIILFLERSSSLSTPQRLGRLWLFKSYSLWLCQNWHFVLFTEPLHTCSLYHFCSIPTNSVSSYNTDIIHPYQ